MHDDYQTVIGEATSTVDRETAMLFAAAVGEDDPVYYDEAAAGDAGYGGIPLPLTFLFTLDSLIPDRYAWRDAVLTPDVLMLHGEQRFDYERTAVVGEQLHVVSRLGRLRSSGTGAVRLLDRQSVVTDAGGRRVASMVNTSVIAPRDRTPARSTGNAEQPGPDPTGPPTGPEVSVSYGVPLSMSRLRLYALASGDDNRMHLNHDAAVGAGQDGIIAHGMLLMAQLARAGLEGRCQRDVTSLRGRFTGVSPLGATHRIETRRERAQVGCQAWIGKRRVGVATIVLRSAAPA
jgi:acyl dehydratase